jgi:parallel beta-helix repeat protein
MKNLAIGCLICISVGTNVWGRIINVPDDYATIQAGIDYSNDGDTVQVWPGTYRENIDFGGHNIVLASRYLLSGDTIFIHTTIIDGRSVRNSVTFDDFEDSTTVLAGFTIRNGYGGNGGGIFSFLADPVIRNNIIRSNNAQNGAGIYLGYSRAQVFDNFIGGNAAQGIGGGVRCFFSDVRLSSNKIIGNSAASGGGIAGNNSVLQITGNAIAENVVRGWPYTGGGIIIDYDSDVSMSNNTLCWNMADSGGGIYCGHNSMLNVSNCILWGNALQELHLRGGATMAMSYCDVRGGYGAEGNIDAEPLLVRPHRGDFRICLSSPCIDAGDPDILDPDGSRSDMGIYYWDHPDCNLGWRWYVSSSGNDITGDGTYSNPFGTIQHGVDMTRYGDTVIVGQGAYYQNVMIVGKRITVGSNYLFTQDSLDVVRTIIHGDTTAPTVYSVGCDSLSLLAGFSINGGKRYGVRCFSSAMTIRHNFFINGTVGAIECLYSTSRITRNLVNNCTYYNGAFNSKGSNQLIDYNRFLRANMDLDSCQAEIVYNTIINESDDWDDGGIRAWRTSGTIAYNLIKGHELIAGGGGGISCTGSKFVIRNNLILDNDVRNQRGGGIYCSYDDTTIIMNNVFSGNKAGHGGAVSSWRSATYLINNILWGDSASTRGNEIDTSGDTWVSASYCDIRGGWEGVGNIDIDPGFRDPAAGDFHLQSINCGNVADSPCIDTGNPEYADSLLACGWGLGATRSDMGAYSGTIPSWVFVAEQESQLPVAFSLTQNYPNPFNAGTMIQYELMEAGDVDLVIFDILGKQILDLKVGWKPAGAYSLRWDAAKLPSGVYFCRLNVGGRSITRKMVLLR